MFGSRKKLEQLPIESSDVKCKRYFDKLKLGPRKLFPLTSNKAKHTIDYLADHNKENEHTNAHSTTPSTTINLPKQNINDVLLEIPIATEANSELSFLTDEDVTTFLDNSKYVQFSNLDTPSDEPSGEPYDNVSDILCLTYDSLYSSPSNEIIVSNIIPTNCNGRINQTIY